MLKVRSLLVLIVTGVLVVSQGCGGEEAAGVGGEAPATVGNSGGGSKATRSRSARSQEKESLCRLLSADEVAGSLAGKVKVEEGFGDPFKCQYEIPGFGQLLVQRMDAGTYEQRKEAYGRTGASQKWVPGLARDAYLLNDAQLEVLVDENDSLSLGLMIAAHGEIPVTEIESSTALKMLAVNAMSRL